MPFPATSWTMLAQATMDGDLEGRCALEELCRAYRPPVVSYLAGRGLTAEQAEDCAQDLMMELIESRAWKRADQSKGRFRSFLLGMLHHIMQQSQRDGARLKRGGGAAMASLEAMADEGVELAQPVDPWEASRFDCAWARALVNQALAELEAAYRSRGEERDFSVVRRYLPGGQTPPSYEESAAELGLSLTALKSAIHRMRKRFRECLRTRVARTVSAPHEVNSELRYLGSLLLHPDPVAQPLQPQE